MRISDWSSDVCSSDLLFRLVERRVARKARSYGPRPSSLRMDFQCAGLTGVMDSRLPGASSSRPCRSCSCSRNVLRSEEHTSELQSLMRISYAVFCLKKKKNHTTEI